MVPQDLWEQKMGSYCFMRTEFQFYKMEELWRGVTQVSSGVGQRHLD